MKAIPYLLALVLLLSACSKAPPVQTPQTDAVAITLTDNMITVDGQTVGTDRTAAVYTANDIVYYESGKDFTYGEGTQKDAHPAELAAAHTVVHIAQPGTYRVSGKLSQGQIAVDLGDKAKEDPDAVVTLILDGVDITCQVAPAVIFYNVYECGSDAPETASKDVDTSAAGANVMIADGTVNTVNGAYVERIYKPDSVILNADKTKVEDADKLHKYDGAFYSKRSMNIFGGTENTGILNINAENEGLDSEMHLTIHGGNIHITSGNDGINTNEDGISVTTVNGGNLTIRVTGETGEGDGIDSNGWLVINGGTVTTAACSRSADAGIDSDMGIHITGGTVIATGHMLDRIESGGQNYAVFNFAQEQSGSETVTLQDPEGNPLLEAAPENAYSILIVSSPDLKAGTYTLWSGSKQLLGSSGGMEGRPGMRPGNPGAFQRPEDGKHPEGDNRPDGFTPPEGFIPPEGGNRPERPEESRPEHPNNNTAPAQELSPQFPIRDGGNTFSNIRISEN